MKRITTFVNNQRTSTQELLNQIYSAIAEGETEFEIDASGQHDIGGPLWDSQGRSLKFVVRNPGQRVASMGMPGTEIIVEGPAPADVGWLNAGATVVVKGDGGDTTGHCAADGMIYIGGRVGTRSGSLMKHDPAYPPPQLWVLKSMGSFSFEFMGGGIAVVCGYGCEDMDSVIGDRPCIGMVGGTVYVRGPIGKLPENVNLIEQLDDEDWSFLSQGMPKFLRAIERINLLNKLMRRDNWQKIVPKTQDVLEKSTRLSLNEFRTNQWFKGGLFGDVIVDSGTVAPLVSAGSHRAYSPIWNNAIFTAPCQYACPSDIPTQDRINLLRKGKSRKALELVLQYSPFPGSVCGAACPNLCMSACTRQTIDYAVLAGPLGRYSMDLPAPAIATKTGKKFAVVGGGVGGLSAAWQLALRGHDVTVFERSDTLGGKLRQTIPHDRVKQDIVQAELHRILSLGIKVEYNYEITSEKFEGFCNQYDGVIIAVGAHKSRILNYKGSEKSVSALEYLTSAHADHPIVDVNGKKVVVIGAGDVGMDVCVVAWQRGAISLTAIDICEPASSSRERATALALGTRVLWPRIVHAYKDGKVIFEDGDTIPADIVIVSIGEIPDSDWIPENIARVKESWLSVNKYGQTSNPNVFAVGDVVKSGLLTEAIGQGRLAALALDAQVMGKSFELPHKQLIPKEKLHLVYFTPRLNQCPIDPLNEADRCISCGTCRDCNICVQICGQNAISRQELSNDRFEFLINDELCIGCGFCAASCPSGIWTMVPNLLYAAESG